MSNINFVPDDYIQNNESCRTNLMYIFLFVFVMAGLTGCFVTIKIRQKACQSQEKIVNEKMAKAHQAIAKFEKLQAKRKNMMKTALMTAELIEPVPRSILLASLTNDLPKGASLVKLSLVQKAPKKVAKAKPKSKFDATADKKAVVVSKEQLLDTNIDIEGIAPSDLQVATYIKRLTDSMLFDNVFLVESKEWKMDDVSFRQFKLKTMLKKGVHLTSEDIEEIKMKCNKAAYTL
ncbi:MAG: PilN domain-containing protein [Planctomycetes bacterium]|nr:PilN domain-containing protein [Planctomycetota bacterium]